MDITHSGERSCEVTRTEVETATPDHVVLHHCGHGTHADAGIFRDRGWDVDTSIHILDDDFHNQPSPHLSACRHGLVMHRQ
ncbi:hypothetical protein [Haloquadratum walsbyi]|uniref:Uncharacterized protein n=1 Tax=Haloquadratum walsbyi J07HQW2 TaxID=1238425 RepID=U1NH60_9EURY|nr:hypothetical protein [Haloquadratum walsbyi]ERG96485.1 MAG: hypothetical protein J07HQW2_02965 [Haloquadratum walsbyi J07HQW2]